MTAHHFALKSQRVLIDGAFIAASVVVKNGKIVCIKKNDDVVDDNIAVNNLGNKALIPGLVDTHVHINEPGRTQWEGFNSATQAAAAGGITTVVDMPLNCNPVTTTAAALFQKLESLEGKLWVDCGFWGGVIPSSLGELHDLIKAGVLGVKSFMIHSGIDDFPEMDVKSLEKAIRILSQYNVPYLIHAELDTDHNLSPIIGSQYQSFLDSRPRAWENEAINELITLLRNSAQEGLAGRIHIVHLSSADAISAIKKAQGEGLWITAETCPHYLTLFSENIPDGKTLFKCCPPIRENENRQRLWQGLEKDILSFIVSDHSPCTPALKQIESGDLERAWGGISSLQFGLSIIWTEAINRGISLERVIDWMATKPAQFAGLGKNKGKIAVGLDADLVVFNDIEEYVIDVNMIKYRHKMTPYAGRKVVGVVERTFVRGNEVYANGDLTGVPVGQPILHTV